MLTARTQSSDTTAHIFDITKADGPFFCRVCSSEVIAKKGIKLRHHYAHKPDSKCHFGRGESDEHLEAKEKLYKYLDQHPNCQKVELEPCFSSGYTDIFAEIMGVDVAIEIQRSDMTVPDILERTRRFTELGYYTLWVQLSIAQADPDTNRYRLSDWRDCLRKLYFGKVYLLDDAEKGSLIALYMARDQSTKATYTALPSKVSTGPVCIAENMKKNKNDFLDRDSDPLLLWTDRFGRWWSK